MGTRLITLCALAVCAAADPLPKDTGYRGIWYYNQPSGDQYAYKYSGGFATYPQQQSPLAYYAKAVNKTFFCYGGTVEGKQELLHMVSYYDHATGQVPRPRILLNKKTEDAHDNPVMILDDAGHIWIFSNAHGTARESFIHKSRKPYSIDEFELVWRGNFSYGHAHFLPGQGFFFPHTRYMDKGRSLFWMTSRDGRQWGEPQLLARIAQGSYQITCREGSRVASAFNYHPSPGGVNFRTNLYYLETGDMGKTWKTVDGKAIQAPLREIKNSALVHDYDSEKLLVYLKTVQMDAQGHPVILYLTSKGYASGPANDPRTWYTARWTGREWQIRRFTTSDHNYDFGSLYIEPDGTWRVIAPTQPGPQPYGTGGDMVMWTSRDQGATWKAVKQLTRNSRFDHSYARKPVNAHAAFYALWADGDPLKPSDSALYFTDREGSHVWKLPTKMKGEFARPEIAW